jgi:heme exporter protein CcmD
MNAIGDWLSMGGYAGFVWPCYLLAAALLVGMALQARIHLSAAQRALGRQEPQEQDTDAPR